MIPKKKRKWVWCQEEPLVVQGQQSNFSGDRVRNKIGKLIKLIHEPVRNANGKLARDENGKLVGLRGLKTPYIKFKPEQRLPSRVVCPHCKKKFKPRIRECGDYNCWHVYIPAHKKFV